MNALSRRVLEPEVMDSLDEALDYDAMDHSAVNALFAADFLAASPDTTAILDLGTGTAQIPIAVCQRDPAARVLGIDLAAAMLDVGRKNVAALGFSDRIHLERVDAKGLPFTDGQFSAVMSNSIVHHIPDPYPVLAEAVRVTQPGGVIFIRDLLRPADELALAHLVATYAAGANPHQRTMFDDSLRAALALHEVRDLVMRLGFRAQTVQLTSDRHWTWSARKKG